MRSVRPVVYKDCPDNLPRHHAVLSSIPSNIDEQNPNRNLLIIIITNSQYNRNSRTGNARRAVSQPDHDILEGLPIRRWQKKAVIISTAGPEKLDTNAVSILQNGYPELEMPKDSNLLPEITYTILRAARMGVIRKEGSDDHEEGVDFGRDNKTQTEEKPGLPTRKWTMFDRDSEPREPEYLAKRRKGLHSLYGGSTAPINTSGQMRKIKIRNVDSEGNSQIVEALVPEGQAVDAEIVEEELTSPTQALAPGTKVEGVGIANAEGVLVPEEQVAPASQRRRPPPPKRRLKGPGRGRKKKVAFASGTDGLTAPSDMQAAAGNPTKPSDGTVEAVNGVQSIEGDNEGEDSVMHDASQDGEEGSEEGSEGDEAEEADREKGEVSASPEAPLEPAKPPTLAEQEPQDEPLTRTGATTVPPVTATNETFEVDVTAPEQQPPKPDEETAPQHMDESPDGPPDEITEIATAKPPAKGIEMQRDMASSAPMAPDKVETTAHATTAPLPSIPTETIDEPSLAAPSSPPSVAQRGGEIEASTIPNTPPQAPIQTAEEHLEVPSVIQLPSNVAGLPPKPPPISNEPDSEPTTQDQFPSRQALAIEQPQEHSVQSPISAEPAEPVPVDLPETQAHRPVPLPPRPPQPIPEGTAAAAFSLEPSAPPHPPAEPAEPISEPTPVASTSTHHPDRQEISQTLPVDSWAAPVEHHTPKAPTPSPPTPIATSFGTHQRERLMESPRAPTMSPPTPARGYSSSPDLPLAAVHGQPPPLELLSASDPPHLPGLGQQNNLPPREERIDVEAAPEAPENVAAEIPHEHNPLDGLVAPKGPPHDNSEHGEGEEQPARFPDGEEDLLGSLERSLGK